jgi:acetyltransferase-like isoleucine patch superfamily enzyme
MCFGVDNNMGMSQQFTGTAIWKYLAFRLAIRPAPKALVAIYLSLRWRSRVSFSADITYPFRLRLGRGVRIGRCKIYCAGNITLGDQAYIHDGVLLDAAGGHIALGHRVAINPYCALSGAGGLTIGNDTGVATLTVIIASNHGIDNLEMPMMQQPLKCVGITIKENVWIGANCVILDGVTIGPGAVVAAGAVVSRNVEEEDIVAGVPARVIKNRRKDSEEQSITHTSTPRSSLL